MKKQSLIVAAAVAATLTSGVAVADLTANGAASTNYIWRGVTQSNDNAAISGGIDWSNDSGFYAGTWVSNINLGQEVDLYGGYATDAFDVGIIGYTYPVDPEINFTEVYVTGGISNFSGGIYATVDAASGNAGGAFDKGDLYITGSADFDAVSVYLGSYMFDNDAAGNLDYIHYGVSTSKDDFTFSIDKTDQNHAAGGAMRIGISWSKEWDL